MIKFRSSIQITSQAQGACEKAYQKLLQRQDLGFWQLPKRDENWQLAEQVGQNLQKKYSHLIVVGMGGSAMGGRALVQSLRPEAKVEFVLNTDPWQVHQLLSREELFKNAHFLFISKSGGTLELACLLELFTEKLRACGRKISEAISVITELKSSALHDWAQKSGCAIAAHPMDVGGRFSVFSPVGMVPAQFAGLSLQALRSGAKQALAQPDVVLGLSSFYWERFQAGEAASAFWLYCQQLDAWSYWLEQLWAESLAKKVKRSGGAPTLASVPVSYQGTCDQHSVLQQLMESALPHSVCFLRSEEKHLSLIVNKSDLQGFEYLQKISLTDVFSAQSQSTERALNEAGVPTCSLSLASVDEAHVAELMMTFELVIGVLGEVMDINAFDQPGVELGKKITKEKLASRLSN